MESIQVLLLLLASSALCYDATSALYPAPPEGGRWKEQLLGQLFEGYDTDVEPPLTSGQLNTTVNVSLNVICVSSLGRQHEIDGSYTMLWKDARLSWDPSSYGGVKTLRVSPSRIWKPDLCLYTAGKKHLDLVQLAIVSYDGSVLWVPPIYLYVPCQDSPDTTSCDFRLGSWTYPGDKIDFRLSSPGLWLDSYVEACPLIVQSHEAKRNVKYYECCDEPYIDISISLQLASRQSP